MMTPLCLASQSKSRQEILDGVKFKFHIQPADIDETNRGESVDDYVTRLSREKAMAVLPGNQSKLIIAADSVVDYEGGIIGKPQSMKDAIEILNKLSGNWHTFVTGFCVIRVSDGTLIQRIVKTRVKLSGISREEIELYVDKIEPFRFAGGFSNSESSWFIEKIEGSISNLMGLPMAEFFATIKELGFSLSQIY